MLETMNADLETGFTQASDDTQWGWVIFRHES